MHTKLWMLMVLWAIPFVHAQESEKNTLSYQEFINNIVNEHPIAKSALLKEKVAKAKLLKAKGGLDPDLISKFDNKEFKDKEYYSIFKNKITIPTALGVAFTAGFDNNSGVFLNPENNITGSGLWSVGIEVDVIQGLLTNPRRTALQQAKTYQNIAKNQQQQLLNELIYTASKAYAEWQQYLNIYRIYQQNYALSLLYLNNTKSALASGEKTAIDTLEANVYLQNSQINLLKYQQLLAEKKLKVENHLWLDNIPVGLQSNIVPENQQIASQGNAIDLENNLDSIPVIAEKISKKEILLLAQKLNREKLKPKLKLKYNPLLYTSDDNLQPNYDVDNYKWGASLKIPLLFRTERGKYRESKYKVEEINYDISFKKVEIKNKIIANRQNQQALTQQISILKQNIVGYQKLLDAEVIKFDLGESSMFLINKRQEKLIESELKLIDTQNKLITNYLDYMLLTNQILPKN